MPENEYMLTYSVLLDGALLVLRIYMQEWSRPLPAPPVLVSGLGDHVTRILRQTKGLTANPATAIERAHTQSITKISCLKHW